MQSHSPTIRLPSQRREALLRDYHGKQDRVPRSPARREERRSLRDLQDTFQRDISGQAEAHEAPWRGSADEKARHGPFSVERLLARETA